MEKRKNRFPLIAGLILLYYAGYFAVGLYTDYLWSDSLGYGAVMLKIIFFKIGLGAGVFAAFFALMALNFLIADVFSRSSFIRTGENAIELPGTDFLPSQIRIVAFSGIAFLSLITGLAASSQWNRLVEFLYASPFGFSDPVFNRDASFYVFKLPFYNNLYQWSITCAVFCAIVSIAVYFVKRGIVISASGIHFSSAMASHASILAAVLLIIKSFGYRLFAFSMMSSSRGFVAGAGYTDVNVRIPLLSVLSIACVVAAIMFGANTILRGYKLPGAALGMLVVIAFGCSAYPEIIQRLRVKPNEISMERPFIKQQISFTRKAFSLNSVEETIFPAEHALTAADIENNSPTIKNIRLWDSRPLLLTYQQLQEIRPYYSFSDVDIDRYMVNGELRQVMLSARELDYAKLPNKNWINERLTFTHGYGVCMTPVNRYTEEGMPEFYIKDIPPVHTANIEVKKPQIYFGELSSDYVITKTDADEFDYPKSGNQSVLAGYEGDGGIVIDSIFKKLIFALRFSSLDLLLNTDINSKSRIMMHRSVGGSGGSDGRAGRIMPLLGFDSDPYVVVTDDGRVKWMLDAFTLSDSFPYSQKMGGGHSGSFNYIRNSAKIVVDAYDGAVDFYAFDETDPLLKTYSKAFPGLFKPAASMPETIRSHIRYPVDLFKIQASIYSTYQMTDPLTFYNKEDKWDNPRELFDQEEIPMEPYYTVMKLPGEQKEEFILMMPFTPANKDNLSAWMCARNDGDMYGKMLVYRFPKKKLIYGPFQVEARIDQDPEISRQLSLWSQKGSRIIRGNLLVIPVEDSLLYVEPIFLKAEKGEIPELKRVVVSIGNKVAMEATLEEALEKLLGPPAGKQAPGKHAASPAAATDESAEDLIRKSLERLKAAKQKVSALDWKGFGEELKALEEALTKLQNEKRGPEKTGKQE